MPFCLTKPLAEKFLKKVKDGTIDPKKLSLMTSVQRRAFLAKIIGEANASKVNALFESKLLLKSQQRGMVNWVKKTGNLKPQAKQDLLSKIEKWDTILNAKSKDSFLADLAEQRIGAAITQEQAKQIFDMSKKVKKSREAIPSDSPAGSKERLAYGTEYALYKDFVADLRLNKPSLLERIRRLDAPGLLEDLSGAAKSMRASGDNSFFLRQGIKVLFDNPKLWWSGFKKSFVDIGKELKGIDAQLPVKADVASRKNALNGKYKNLGVDVGVEFEEAFPSAFPEKIPVYKRFYKASESAYANAALRMRADMADEMIAKLEQQGINTGDKEAVKKYGELINVMTGRGHITSLGEKPQRIINSALFSIKFWKSNWDFLMRGLTGGGKVLLPKAARPKLEKLTGIDFNPDMADKLYARGLMSMVLSVSAILTLAEMFVPGSIEKDPRSSRFGKIRIGNIYHDMTGGVNGVLRFAMNFVPTEHNGQWGIWQKSGRTDKFVKIFPTTGGYGARDLTDVVVDYWKGKLSPLAASIRDVVEGQMFGGIKPTKKTILLSLTVPITAEQTMEWMNAPGSDWIIANVALDMLGAGGSSPFFEWWYADQSKEKQEFHDKVGDDLFKEANAEYNFELQKELESLLKQDTYIKASDDDKTKLIAAVKRGLKKSVFKKFELKK